MRSREIERQYGDGTSSWQKRIAKRRMLKDYPWLHDCFRQRPDVEKGLRVARLLLPFGVDITTLNYMGGLSGSRYGHIKWNICEGYGSLLHEVAHQLLGHCRPGREEDKMTRERTAWEMSEQLCKEYGLRFNYHVAESFYKTYGHGLMVEYDPIVWKWEPKRRTKRVSRSVPTHSIEYMDQRFATVFDRMAAMGLEAKKWTS